MTGDSSVKNTHSKIVLDYSFCNASNIWNYLGVITIFLFVTILISYLKHRQRQKTLRHYKTNYNSIYLIVLIVLGLFFVIPLMCWLLTFVEILVTFVRYGQIPASPLPILTLPIRAVAFIYLKITTAIHIYLTAPGTFIFLLFFIALACIKYLLLILLRFGLPGFFLFSYIGFALPLYALSEVGNVDSWIDLAFTSQLPLFIIYKFRSLLLAMKPNVLWVVLFLVFLLGCYLKFGITMLFVCKCFLAIVLIRFTYVIGRIFVFFVFSKPVSPQTGRASDDGH
ncbi:unnamed protein product [Adineta ricciae]|uniref:Uncharacterized protein n=1 Tax=Adineta ricciae TaxID=249248 RepID=A0A814AVX2_ADIRI|nr:unnamed protein product [Adineta ricciae]CAF0920639.1 unnamed protein product [Adineta ricciae]